MISRIDVEAAQTRIGSRVRRTPVLESGGLWLKLEHLQHTGSFKARGAFNRILSAAEHGALPPEGVVTASGGNAGLAIAYAARELGVPARVFVPETAPKVKVDRLRDLGADVVQVGTEYADAYEAAVRRARARCSATRTTRPRSAPARARWPWSWRSRPAASTPSWSPSAAEA